MTDLGHGGKTWTPSPTTRAAIRKAMADRLLTARQITDLIKAAT